MWIALNVTLSSVFSISQSDNSSIVKRNDTFEELSCDESTSDSGRGGSDLELNKEKGKHTQKLNSFIWL